MALSRLFVRKAPHGPVAVLDVSLDDKEAVIEAQQLLSIEDGTRDFGADPAKKTPQAGPRAFGFVIKTVILVSWLWLAYLAWSQQVSRTCLLGNERAFDDAPEVYQNVRFQRAGFHDLHHGHLTSSEGPPNDQNNAAWAELLKVGVVRVSEQENARIENGTASTRRNAHEHFVELEMFHQLHCLKWLRDQFWQLNTVATNHVPFEDDFFQRVNHTDHCIDYLRQVIMCHGDMTPITFEWIPEIDGYIARHSTPHQCRNFEAIYAWASERRIPGLKADGRHKNVELNVPELQD